MVEYERQPLFFRELDNELHAKLLFSFCLRVLPYILFLIVLLLFLIDLVFSAQQKPTLPMKLLYQPFGSLSRKMRKKLIKSGFSS
jgi:hypothetical protein